MEAQVLERDTAAVNVELEVADEILTEYLGMLSREISAERRKSVVNERKISVLQEECEKVENMRHSLTLEDSALINRVLYLYGLAVRKNLS